MKKRQIHLNEFQQKYYLTQANFTVGIVGRAGGKTYGLHGPFLAENILSMPRSTGRLASYTYDGLLTNILPGILKNWEDMYGWVENVHYFVGKWAPESWGWKRPYFASKGDAKHLIHIYNGTALQMASMDRTLNNGASIDFLGIDETRLIRRLKISEMIPAMRGNLSEFGHLSNYQSILLTSDMPQFPTEKWLLEYENQHTEFLIEGILAIQQFLQPKLEMYVNAQGQYKENLKSEIKALQDELNYLRRKAMMYFEGSSLENAHVIGKQTLLRWRKTLTEHEFAVTVLNERQDKVLNGFYAALDPEKHSYDGVSNYELFDSIEDPHKSDYSRDCRMDGDYIDSDPLYIAFDHNAAINSMVIGQPRPNNTYHIIQVMYVKQPKYLADLIDKFLDYYRHAKNKTVVYYYDATSIKDNSQGQEKERDEVIRRLSLGGWNIRDEYLGKTMSHHSKYKMWQSVLSETDPSLPILRYNRVNCLQLEKSMLNADVRRVRDEYRKDKTSENKNYKTGGYKVAPEDATHISEGADTLLLGFISKHNQPVGFSDLVSV